MNKEEFDKYVERILSGCAEAAVDMMVYGSAMIEIKDGKSTRIDPLNWLLPTPVEVSKIIKKELGVAIRAVNNGI